MFISTWICSNACGYVLLTGIRTVIPHNIWVYYDVLDFLYLCLANNIKVERCTHMMKAAVQFKALMEILPLEMLLIPVCVSSFMTMTIFP